MTDAELAYAAGILDGEGSICLCKRPGQWPRLEVAVASTDIELLEWLQERWGGRLVEKKTYQAHHKRSWMLHYTFKKASRFLIELEPFLVIERKKRRARLGIEYAEAAVPNGQYTAAARQRRERVVELFNAS